MDPRNPQHIYIGVGAGSLPFNQPPYGVFKSLNGGDTWTQVLDTGTRPLANIWTMAIDPKILMKSTPPH